MTTVYEGDKDPWLEFFPFCFAHEFLNIGNPSKKKHSWKEDELTVSILKAFVKNP